MYSAVVLPHAEAALLSFLYGLDDPSLLMDGILSPWREDTGPCAWDEYNAWANWTGLNCYKDGQAGAVRVNHM